MPRQINQRPDMPAPPGSPPAPGWGSIIPTGQPSVPEYTPGYAETGRNPFAMGPGPAGSMSGTSQWGSMPNPLAGGGFRNMLVGGLGTLAGMATGIPFGGLLGGYLARRHFGGSGPEFEGSGMFLPSYLPGGQDHGHLNQPGGYNFADDAQDWAAGEAARGFGTQPSMRGSGFVQGLIDPASLGPYIPGQHEGNIPMPQQGAIR